SSSVGFAAGWPAGSNERFSTLVWTGSVLTRPVRRSLSPGLGGRPSAVWQRGWRRSASTRRTLAPQVASAAAMLTAVVVLPSAPVALETRITRGEMARDSRSAVRSVRYASAGGGTEPLPRSSGGDAGSAAGLAWPFPLRPSFSARL